MGTTISTVHVYTTEPVSPEFGAFVCISEGWQSYLPKYDDCDPAAMRKLAKKLSKQIAAPVLLFWEMDSDRYGFVFLVNGKCVSSFSLYGISENKGLFKVPQLVGYEEGNKRRISEILSCGDIDTAIAMLEEFFGVAVCCDREAYDSDPKSLIREKGSARYAQFAEEEKKLRGKRAPLELRLIEEIPGKLFWSRFSVHDAPYHSLYYYGYRDSASADEKGRLAPVKFENGCLHSITQEEFDAAPIAPHPFLGEDPRYDREVYPKCIVTFKDSAPLPFIGKRFILPPGYYPFGFWGEDKFVIFGGSSLAVMNCDGAVIAKSSIKGDVIELKDGYVLTTSGDSFCGYYYHPKAVIRIYKLIEKGGADCHT